MLFSQTTQAFYDESLDYPSLPQDVTTVDSEVWLETLSKINKGYFAKITADKIVFSNERRPNKFYSYNVENEKWIQTEEQKVLQIESEAKSSLSKAQIDYDNVSKSIQDYSDRLQDEDYSVLSKETLITLKSTLITYRKALRSYLTNGDGTIDPPTPPKIIGG